MFSIDRRRRQFLAGLLAAPACAVARPTPLAPPLLLAHDAPAAMDPAGFLVSEKMDGVRAFWDGTRLAFRSGLPIAAPAWFMERLPPRPLDGELWSGRGAFESLSGAVRRAEPQDADWRDLRYVVFELPGAPGPFAARAAALQRIVHDAACPQLAAAEQRPVADTAALQRHLVEVVRGGGEGLMLHRADAPYVTGRSSVLLKLKPLRDAEATVLGHVEGQGRLRGHMGALRVRTDDGREFFIGTGFTDAQRAAPPRPGRRVTFAYQGVTRTGLPRFASFVRMRDE